MSRLTSRIGIVLALVFFIPLAAPFGIQEYYYARYLDPQFSETQRQLKRHLRAYLEDRRFLAAVGWLGGNSHDRDAGPFFNATLSWNSTEKGLQAYSQVSQVPLRLPAAVMAGMEKWKGHDLDHLSEIDWRSIDFSWLASLAQFDYWDIHHHSPIEKVYREQVLTQRKEGHLKGDLRPPLTPQMEPFSFVVSHPLPDFKSLVVWARLRWMRAAQDGSFLSAALQTRHLARLALSTETLVGGLAGTAILGTEISAHQAALEKHLAIPSDWHPPSAELKSRLARFILGTAAYFSPLAEKEMLQAIFLASPFLPLTCGAVMEGIQNQSLPRSVLKNTLPLERGFGRRYRELDRIVALYTKQCRLPYAEAVWDNPRANALIKEWSTETGPSGFTARKPWLLYFPFARTIVGGTLLALGSPSFLRRYDDPLPEPF